MSTCACVVYMHVCQLLLYVSINIHRRSVNAWQVALYDGHKLDDYRQEYVILVKHNSKKISTPASDSTSIPLNIQMMIVNNKSSAAPVNRMKVEGAAADSERVYTNDVADDMCRHGDGDVIIDPLSCEVNDDDNAIVDIMTPSQIDSMCVQQQHTSMMSSSTSTSSSMISSDGVCKHVSDVCNQLPSSRVSGSNITTPVSSNSAAAADVLHGLADLLLAADNLENKQPGVAMQHP